MYWINFIYNNSSSTIQEIYTALEILCHAHDHSTHWNAKFAIVKSIQQDANILNLMELEPETFLMKGNSDAIKSHSTWRLTQVE